MVETVFLNPSMFSGILRRLLDHVQHDVVLELDAAVV